MTEVEKSSPDPLDPPPRRGPSQEGKRGQKPGEPGGEPKPPKFLRFALWIALLAALLLFLGRDFAGASGATIPYSEFRRALAEGRIVECVLRSDRILGRMKPAPKEAPPAGTGAEAPAETAPAPAPEETEPPAPKPAAEGDAKEGAVPAEKSGSKEELVAFQTLRVEDPELVADLEAKGVEYTGAEASVFFQSLLTWLLPLFLIFAFWMFLFRRSGGLGNVGGAAMSFGKSKAKLVADMHTGVDFGDVAGCDEAKLELQEVVDFLRHPSRYEKLGAKIPKGVLLVGPPGTGKTLLARAVAGEAQVPFYSISGSDFVEMFVGVGAARVRDLFEQAQKSAPCIVFIDEIDAIGRARGVHMSPVNDEREQTLNQLLVEMDGFEPNSGVILLAATNRPDVLDRALLRPGRFDRQVVLDVPDFQGRLAILKVHARGKPTEEGLDLASIARGTPGFSGADLANAMNEAALLAARRGATEIRQGDIEEAVEKLVAGPERKSRRLREEEKRRVAYHESGHALVAAYCEHADPVHKISIVPRGRAALGFTMQLPAEEQMMLTRAQLDDKVTGMLGGRAAEETIFSEVSTGAANDLEQATALVRQMVCLYGMGESAGLMHCAREPMWPGAMNADGAMQRDCSEATAREIDEEVRALLASSYERALGILREHEGELERLAKALLAQETLSKDEFERLIGKKKPA